jgi:hypothetical protein
MDLSRGLGDVYKRQMFICEAIIKSIFRLNILTSLGVLCVGQVPDSYVDNLI